MPRVRPPPRHLAPLLALLVAPPVALVAPLELSLALALALAPPLVIMVLPPAREVVPSPPLSMLVCLASLGSLEFSYWRYDRGFSEVMFDTTFIRFLHDIVCSINEFEIITMEESGIPQSMKLS